MKKKKLKELKVTHRKLLNTSVTTGKTPLKQTHSKANQVQNTIKPKNIVKMADMSLARSQSIDILSEYSHSSFESLKIDKDKTKSSKGLVSSADKDDLVDHITTILNLKLDPVLNSLKAQVEIASSKFEQFHLNHEKNDNIKIEEQEPCDLLDLNPHCALITIPAKQTDELNCESEMMDAILLNYAKSDSELIEIDNLAEIAPVEQEKKDLVALPASVIDRIYDDRERRIKWSTAYFGYSEHQQPSAALEM
jgi:hypothetical protein